PLERCRGVVNARAFELLATVCVQSPIICTGRNEEAFRLQGRKATLDLKAGAIFIAVVIVERKRLCWRGKFCTEPVSLKLRAIGQIAAVNSGWETEKVFDQGRGPGLSSRSVAFQDDGFQSLGRRIHRCGQTRRTGANNRQVA